MSQNYFSKISDNFATFLKIRGFSSSLSLVMTISRVRFDQCHVMLRRLWSYKRLSMRITFPLNRATSNTQSLNVYKYATVHCFSGIFGVCFSCGSVNNLCEAILLLVARLPSYWVASIPPPHYGPPIKSLERNHGDNSPPYSSPPPPPLPGLLWLSAAGASCRARGFGGPIPSPDQWEARAAPSANREPGPDFGPMGGLRLSWYWWG